MQNKINSSKKYTPDNNEKIPYMKRTIEHWKIYRIKQSHDGSHYHNDISVRGHHCIFQ